MKRKLIAFMLLVILIFAAVGCNGDDGKNELFVTWMDTDGKLIESQTIKTYYNPSERRLPDDSDLWHYTGWTISQSGNIIVCTAKRVAKTHIVWNDYNGTVLNEVFILEDEDVPSFDLPESNDKWLYEEWKKITETDKIVFQAVRTPKTEYFLGNVFQIIVNDRQGKAVSSGSGFIINNEGWFVTNYHVMDDGYSATAYFDIKDATGGEQYTKLKVIGGVYGDKGKDIFIGKLEGYEKIKSYYKVLTFTEKYTVGEISYSVGYPNSSIKLEINSGKILEEYSDIYNKIDGVYYVMSDSYIAPGSSGGILINENFEIIGITSMGLYGDSNKNYYISGGSIPYVLFKNNISNLNANNLKPLSYI